MMHPASQPTRDRSAIALSIVAHGCLFALLASTVHLTLIGAPEQVEHPQIFTITRLSHHSEPARRKLVRATPLPFVNASDVSVRLAAPISRKVATNPRPVAQAQRDDVEQAGPVAGVAHAAAAAHTTSDSTVVSPSKTGTATDVALATPVPTSTPAPTAAPTATPAPAVVAGEDGLFGSNYRPLPQPPNALAAIIGRITGRYHIRIKVDENGHALDVRFVMPITDATLASDVRTRLLAMNYVPALCSGLKCVGDLDIQAP
jgi:hypothetical protein